MSQSRVAGRYAMALVNEARQANVLDEVANNITAIGVALHESKDLIQFFRSPVISVRKKQEALRAVLVPFSVHELTTKFLLFLVEKRREHEIHAIINAVDALYCDLTNTIRVQVRTAIATDADEQRQIEAKITVKTGKRPLASYSVDESLIGGFVAQIGDTNFDCSVQFQLQRLSHSLMGA